MSDVASDWLHWLPLPQDGRVTYRAETGNGRVQKEALLTDSDILWAEFRHAHIGKVLTDLGERSSR